MEELEAAAVESLPHVTGGVHRAVPRPGTVCANCGAVLQGPFCHVCGQDCDTHKRSILHLGMEMFEGVVRVRRTPVAHPAGLLFFQPEAPGPRTMWSIGWRGMCRRSAPF